MTSSSISKACDIILKPRERHLQVAHLLQDIYGDEITAIMLTLGEIMGPAGNAERDALEKAGVSFSEDERDSWSKDPRYLARALRAGIETLMVLFEYLPESARSDNTEPDEEARAEFKEIIDHMHHSPYLPRTHLSILEPLLIPLLYQGDLPS